MTDGVEVSYARLDGSPASVLRRTLETSRRLRPGSPPRVAFGTAAQAASVAAVGHRACRARWPDFGRRICIPASVLTSE